MGSVGDAYDNAMAESFFATLECELLDRRRFKTQAEARIAVVVFAGEGADLINDVPPAGAIVARLVTEAERALAAGTRHVV
jgi:hypothetical protein